MVSLAARSRAPSAKTLDREPFVACRIATSAGGAFVIRDPHTVALMKSQVFIAHTRSDRWTFILLLRVVTVETTENGQTPRRRRRA